MLAQQQIDEEVRRLDQAETTRKQTEPSTIRFPEMEIKDAYAIQKAWMQLKQNKGRKVIGHKIGLTSKVMQVAMGINEPDSGVLLDDMIFENNSNIQAANFLDPKIEVELAFVLKKRLFGENLTIEEVLDATDYVIPALELIAARTYRKNSKTGYVRTVRDTI